VAGAQGLPQGQENGHGHALGGCGRGWVRVVADVYVGWLAEVGCGGVVVVWVGNVWVGMARVAAALLHLGFNACGEVRFAWTPCADCGESGEASAAAVADTEAAAPGISPPRSLALHPVIESPFLALSPLLARGSSAAAGRAGCSSPAWA